MMQVMNGLGNGFDITEYGERNNKKISIEILNDGIPIGTEFYDDITPEKKEQLIASYIAMEMGAFGIDESLVFEERVRFAKKIMELKIINDYKIFPIGKESIDCEIHLLTNGEFAMSTFVYNLTTEDFKKLRGKLNRIKQFQLDVRNQVRPLYGVEIISMIN